MKVQSISAILFAAACGVPAGASYVGAPNPSAPDATAVYLFDGNLNDATSFGRTLRGEAGPITYTSGLNGQAFNSNLPNNHPATMLGLVDHGGDEGVLANTSNFAVEMAVNVQQNISQCYLGANSVPGWGGNNRVFALRGNADPADSTRIYFEFGVQDEAGNLLTASSPSVPFSLVQNKWVTIAGRSTGSTLELYVNGALANSTNSAGANVDFQANQTVIRIGTDWGGGYAAFALIDDVAIYNTARTNFQAIPAGPWSSSGSGDWNEPWNWNGTVPNGVDAQASLLGAISSAQTVYTNTAVTVGTLRFDNANRYQITGNGNLTIDVSSGSGSIEVLSGSHKINLPLFISDNTTAAIAGGAALLISDPMTLMDGSVLTKTGDGTLTIEAPVYNTAPATIASAAGVTNALMDLGSNTTLNVSGGTTSLVSTQHLAAMNVSGGTVKIGPGTGVVASSKAVTISGDGKIDLQNSKMIIDYDGAAGATLAGVKAAIASGSLSSSHLSTGRAIGYGEASDLFAGPAGSFAGQIVDSSSVVLAYTVTADASLDGTVNSADFNLLAGHYGQLAGSRWTQGDFDGDGKVNTLDFNLLAGNFGVSLPAGSATLGATVPEPVSISVAVLGWCLARRRR